MLALAPRHALLALAVLVSSCDTKPKTGAAPSASASAAPRGLTPELAARVLAKVGAREITLGEFAATLERMDPFERLRYQSAERRKQLLDELIDLELLAEERADRPRAARRRGAPKRPRQAAGDPRPSAPDAA
jgi:peptidyl-prolyl cis-trans isomerase C